MGALLTRLAAERLQPQRRNAKSLHVAAGAGSTGSRTALLLGEAGEQVRLVSRRGLGPERPSIEMVIGDTADAAASPRWLRVHRP